MFHVDKMDHLELLERIGLTHNETKVYLFLLHYGESKAGRIAKETGIQRSAAYGSIAKLVHKGLVSYVLKGRLKIFQASSPDKILEYIQEKEELAKRVVPELKKIHQSVKTEGQVQLFKGKKGVKTVLQDIIKEGKENLLFGSENQLEEGLPYYKDQFIRQLREKKIAIKQLVRIDRATKTDHPRTTRYVPRTVKSPVVTNIYGNKIALIIWTNIPEAIVIENKAAAEAYRSYFAFMWEHAKKKKE